MIIHRLHWGGTMLHVPATLLEGGDFSGHDSTDEGTGSGVTHPFIPWDARLDKEVAALHGLARVGRLPADAAERQINTYLLLHQRAALPNGFPPGWFRMPLTDAPHHGLMPDLGQLIHQVLMREPLACALSQVIEQCIPRFRHATRPIQYVDSQPVLLTLVMGLLLGLYKGGVKKPGFHTRAALFARLRALMTSPPEEQTSFCALHEPILLLACMEYMARVLPLHMPVHHRAITTADPAASAFYRRIPPLTDELRQWVDRDEAEGGCPSWAEILAECSSRVERVTRLKRGAPSAGGAPDTPTDALSAPPPRAMPTPHPSTPTQWRERPCPRTARSCWDVPLVARSASTDDFRLLGGTLELPGELIRRIQHDVQVHALPANLREMQLEGLRARGRDRIRASFLQARWPVCMHCVATLKPPHATPPPRLQMRLDTLTQGLVCATCLGQQIVHINMIGRILVYFRTAFYLCPTCFTVQAYSGGHEQPWLPQGGCQHHAHHVKTQLKNGRRRNACFVCNENALTHSLMRVDHLTGLMQEFHYCQRHTPRAEAARWCVNARQLAALDPKATRQKRGY